MPKKLRYSNFYHRIDVDAFEDAIGFETLEQRDGNDVGQCPDYWGLHKHGDTTGKFGIEREKRLYNCWVCGGGTLLSLAMEAKQMDADEATNWIHQFAEDGPISDDSFKNEFAAKLTEEVEEKQPLPWFNPRVLDRYDTHHEWFDERGITNVVRQYFHAGYNPTAMRRAKKEGDEDYVGPVIVLPHFWGGKLVGWQQRWLDEDRPKRIPKYTNSPDFPKDETIFNYDMCVHIPGRIVVVESVPTAMYLTALGIPTVATFGSNVTENQMRLLRSFRDGVSLWPDYDAPGAKWIESLRLYLDPYIPVWEIDPAWEKGEGADPGDLNPERVMLHYSAEHSTLLEDMFRWDKE